MNMRDRNLILDTIQNATQKSSKKLIPQPYRYTEGNTQSLLKQFADAAKKNNITTYITNKSIKIPFLIMDQYPQLFKTEQACVAPVLKKLNWSPSESFFFGKNNGDYSIGISRANAAVAQTGAFVLFNHTTNPSSINFLSKHHIIILDEADIVESMTDIWNLNIPLTNAIHFISGPSSTADIGGLFLVGVHGPVKLSCYIVKAVSQE